jgi:hypothetical protein
MILDDQSKVNPEFLYERNVLPFGRSWEEWVTLWCNWMLSIPKKNNPSLDETGKYCSVNQSDKNVWFLTGTFGNTVPIIRKCTITEGKAILFPVLEKEDSLAEDSDLRTDSDLIKRSRDATDRVLHMQASINGHKVEHIENYRVHSGAFDLTFPDDNVYDVRPGLTRSVCDGYWLFIKPLPLGKHYIHFKGENLLAEPYTTAQLKKTDVFNQILEHINENFTFKLEVIYELTVIKQ